MSTVGQSAFKLSDQLLGELRQNALRTDQTPLKTEDKSSSSTSFIDYLKEGIQEVNQAQADSEKMATDLATGKQENIHETMLRLTQADLSFNLMVQVRNKVLEAYQDVMRMPV